MALLHQHMRPGQLVLPNFDLIIEDNIVQPNSPNTQDLQDALILVDLLKVGRSYLEPYQTKLH